MRETAPPRRILVLEAHPWKGIELQQRNSIEFNVNVKSGAEVGSDADKQKSLGRTNETQILAVGWGNY
jgi:hypothetical protein